MILILDDILHNEECNVLIKIYQKNKQYAHTHGNLINGGNPIIHPLDINKVLMGISKEDGFTALEAAKKIEKIVKKYFYLNSIDWCEIVKWPCDVWQNYHLDKASNQTSITSITYLNDDFDGGSTIFHDGTKIKPKIGRTLIFDGNKYIHGVEPVLKSERYTLPIWYKNL